MLLNSSAGRMVIAKSFVADSAFSRAMGLMFEDPKKFDYGLIFELPSESTIGASVHMIFVFFPIDIVFLDSSRRAVDKATLTPWMLNYTPKKAAKYFVELPAGLGKGISIGDRIEWNYKN